MTEVLDYLLRYWYRFLVLGLSVWIITPILADRDEPSLINYLGGLLLGGGFLITGMAWANDTKDPREETAFSLGALVLMMGFILWHRL